jgi:hypothetical protein
VSLQSKQQISATVLNYGVIGYKEITSSYTIENSGGRVSSEASGMQVIESTSNIPMQLGVAFGFSWEIKGLGDLETIVVEYKHDHPEMISPSGQKSYGVTEYITHEVINGVVNSIDGFEFSEEYELVPGIHTISIVYRDVMLSHQFKISM